MWNTSKYKMSARWFILTNAVLVTTMKICDMENTVSEKTREMDTCRINQVEKKMKEVMFVFMREYHLITTHDYNYKKKDADSNAQTEIMGLFSNISEKLNKCSKRNQFVMGKLEEDFQDVFDFVISGNLALAQLQLKEYTDVNFKNSSKSTLLITACRSKANEKDILNFIQFLLNKGAYIMKKDPSGRTDVDYCEQHKLFQVKMLLCETYDSIIMDNIVDFF